MLAYSLVKKVTNKFDSLVNLKIADGADGEVFTTIDNRVIKFAVHYCWQSENTDSIIESRLKTYQAIKENSNVYATVYDYGYIGKGTRQTVSGTQDYILFYYVTERCDKISEDESKVFHSILSHEDSNKSKTYSLAQVKEMLHGMSYGLDFSINDVVAFYVEINKCNVKHLDVHPRNIMKVNNKFKFIDFDRCSIM